MKYLPSEGLNWRGVLKGMKKATNSLQPIYEAVTNSLEAIDLRKKKGDDFKPFIEMNFYFNQTIGKENCELSRVVIKDNGIGFDDENFSRLQIFKDDTKGYNNRGSGRVQLIHAFKTATYESTYKLGTGYGCRKFVLSKAEPFLQNNAIIRLDKESQAEEMSDLVTILTLDDLRLKADVSFFNNQTVQDIKDALLNHYILYFCANKAAMPHILINYHDVCNLVDTISIQKEDIPDVSHEDESISVPLSQMSQDMKRIEHTEKNIDVTIKSYKLSPEQLKRNAIKVTCKGEVVDSIKIKLDCLPSDMLIENSYFLFLLESEYFDDLVGDDRDSLEILNKTDFKKRAKQYGSIEPQIVLEDLATQVSNKAGEMFSEISKQKDVYTATLEELKQTYLLSDEAISEIDMSDNVEDILKKAYAYDAKLIAERDAAYYKKLEDLNSLNTSSPTYHEDLQNLVNEMSKSIPLQDKESLSRYVTHRKLVLELMEKILKRETDIQCQIGNRNIDEKLLHNLLFTQHSYDTGNSDLWMLNEDYLHFRGVSEEPLNKIKIDNVKLFKEDITEEERKYLMSLGENRGLKRPDILLFPSERKCIIIELKTPDTNISLHLDQIKKYAYWLRNFAREEFNIDTFYGYLIGEAIEPKDVRAADGRFKLDPKFNFMYLPSAPVVCEEDSTGRHDGSLYMEILSYSVILQRAVNRNDAFMRKLFPPKNETKYENKSVD